MKRNPLVLNLFVDLIEEESKRQGVPLDAIVCADACYEKLYEAVEQQAYELVLDVREARESLPPWENPTGDVPEMSELVGKCR